MTEKEVIKLHLTNFYKQTSGYTFFSGFCGALKDARKMTGRNIETGIKDNSNNFGHLGSWLGTLGYLSLLEQIGNCFSQKNKPKVEENKSGIIKALKYFSELDDLEIDVIYALRNSFAHDFSLQNIGKRQGLTHYFVVDNSDTNPVIVLPHENWNGIEKDKSQNNFTYVNLQGLGDLIEELIINLNELAEKNKVEIVLQGGKDELINRYSFMTGKKVI